MSPACLRVTCDKQGRARPARGAGELGAPVDQGRRGHGPRFPAAAEIGNMFQYYYLAEAEFTGSRDLAVCRALNPALQTFRSWLRTHPVPAQ